MLWLGLGQGAEAFAELAHRTEACLEQLQTSFDRKPVLPHLSLARFAGRDLSLVDLPIAKLPALRIDKIAIVESRVHGPDRGYIRRHECSLLAHS